MTIGLIAITGAHARVAEPYATHQKLDLNAVYRPFAKLALTLDGVDTEGKVRRTIRASLTPRMGPVHIALPSDVARGPDRESGDSASVAREPDPIPPASEDAIEPVAAEIARARRPVVILGLDLEPRLRDAVRDLVEALGAPVFVTPKAKGILPEDHPLFHGVCAGVAGDALPRPRGPAGRPRLRARRVRQALAPDDEARRPQPDVDRGR